MIFLLLSCAGTEDSAVAEPACEITPTWENFGDGFFATYCRSCHSATTPDRHDATEGVDFDTLEDVRTWAQPIENAVLVRGDMPIGGGVYPDDLELLEAFLTCGL